MKSYDYYIISQDKIDSEKILDDWSWLIGNDKELICLTRFGDMLLKNGVGQLFFLDIGSGVIKRIEADLDNFLSWKLPVTIYEECFLPTVIHNLEESGKRLEFGQIYGFNILPIAGGSYHSNNIFAINMEEWLSCAAFLHFQIKDLPDGASVNFVVE